MPIAWYRNQGAPNIMVGLVKLDFSITYFGIPKSVHEIDWKLIYMFYDEILARNRTDRFFELKKKNSFTFKCRRWNAPKNWLFFSQCLPFERDACLPLLQSPIRSIFHFIHIECEILDPISFIQWTIFGR